MKRLIVSTLLLLLVSAGHTGFAQAAKPEKNKNKTKDAATQPANLPYATTYSSQWTMGNPALAKRVLDEYRHFETATPGDPNFLADTVAMVAGGQVMQGKDQVAGAVEQARSMLSSVQFIPSAVLALRSTDRDENWVAVWGTQKSKMPDNSEVSIDFNHVWRFNKDGKVDYIQMLESKSPPPPQQ